MGGQFPKPQTVCNDHTSSILLITLLLFWPFTQKKLINKFVSYRGIKLAKRTILRLFSAPPVSYTSSHSKQVITWRTDSSILSQTEESTTKRITLCAPGGGGDLNKFLYREDPARGPTLKPFYIPFFTKKVSLSFTWSIEKWYPFHIPCLELCIPFNCCKCIII